MDSASSGLSSRSLAAMSAKVILERRQVWGHDEAWGWPAVSQADRPDRGLDDVMVKSHDERVSEVCLELGGELLDYGVKPGQGELE